MKEQKINLLQNTQPILISGQINITKIISDNKIHFCDLFNLDGNTATIKEVRDLFHFISFYPVLSKKKVIIISDTDKLSVYCANTLLKTLEEPPEYVSILLSSENINKILPTIISRCHRINFNKDFTNEPADYLSPKEISAMSVVGRFQWVLKISEKEKKDILPIIYEWQKYFRAKMLDGEDVLCILHQLKKIRDLLRTNISVKLLLENIIIKF